MSATKVRTYTVRLAINNDTDKVYMVFHNIHASDADEAAAVCVLEAEKTSYRGWVLDGPVEQE